MKTVPERAETIEAQLRWLAEGKRRAVLVPDGTEVRGETPEEMEATATPAGIVFFNPKLICKEAIHLAARTDSLGELLGYGVPRKPIGPGTQVCVVIRAGSAGGMDGVEKQAVVTDEAGLQAVIAAAESMKDPGDVVKLESPEEVLRARGEKAPMPVITVRATTDWQGLDEILRDPEVYEGQRADGCPAMEEATVRRALDNPANLALEVLADGHRVGFFLLIAKGPGVYEVHTNFLKEARGAVAVAAGKLAQDWMFLATGARRLLSYCPHWNGDPDPDGESNAKAQRRKDARGNGALGYARACGWKTDFVRSGALARDGKRVDVTYASLDLWQWLRTLRAETRARFIKTGQGIHEQLFKGLGEVSHPEDEAHDLILGLAAELACVHGQPEKAEWIFNEWAAQAGYARIEWLGSRNGSVAVSMQGAVVTVDRALKVRVVKQ